MKLQERIWIVASGDSGFSMTSPSDCTVYLLDGHGECALIDAGSGADPALILEEIRKTGHDPGQIGKILLTHGHGDHSGGAWVLAQACGARVFALGAAARFVTAGDERALSIDAAVRAGVFDADFSYHACETVPLWDGQKLSVGDLQVEVIGAEGHCVGHCCYETEVDGQRALFTGDSVLFDGKISLQPIWDCDLQKYVQTCRRIAARKPDLFLPGHGAFSLQRGYVNGEKAVACIEKLGIPLA